MAKSKSTNSAKSQSNAPTKRGSSASGNGLSRPSAAKKSESTTQPAFSPHDIGNVAGEIWALLTGNGEQTLAAIKKSVEAPPDIVLAAIGWLAREDKLDFATSGRAVKISLR